MFGRPRHPGVQHEQRPGGHHPAEHEDAEPEYLVLDDVLRAAHPEAEPRLAAGVNTAEIPSATKLDTCAPNSECSSGTAPRTIVDATHHGNRAN